MVARLAPLPPVSSTSWQRGSAKGSTSGASGVGTAVSSVEGGGHRRAHSPWAGAVADVADDLDAAGRAVDPHAVPGLDPPGRVGGADDGRDAELAGDDGGVAAMPPASVTRPAILVNSTTHDGLVIRHTTISPLRTSPNCSAESTTRAVPSTTPAEAGRPGISPSWEGAGRFSFSGKAHSDQ